MIRPADISALSIGTLSGSMQPDQLEATLAAFAASLAVYVLRAAIRALKKKSGDE